MKKKSSNFLIICGILCWLGAFSLYSYNLEVDSQGAVHCATIATEFEQLVPLSTGFSLDEPEELVEEAPTVPRNEGILIQGDLYIGLLQIPSINLSLPIHMDLTMSKLKTAPCVYLGNLSDNNLIIAGHNYRSHFWDLRYVKPGTEMSITDSNGYVYRYKVDIVERLYQNEVERMKDRDAWDLTLYTCDYPDNTYRIVLRCVRTW